MIVIQGNADEYLLSIPAAQKERAKGIPGRRWDIERKVWKFKRTQEAYDALIAEFGDDLAEITITRPSSPEDSGNLQRPKWPYPSNQPSVVPAKPPSSIDDSSHTTLQSRLAELENELDSSRKRIAELELAKDPSSVEGFVAFAIATARGNAQLKKIITDHIVGDSHFDSRLPIVLATELERHLRKKLKLTDPILKLHDILGLAKEADLLSGDNIDFAHIIRKQRNFFAHQNVDRNVEVMRILFTISAASLLWPHITG